MTKRTAYRAVHLPGKATAVIGMRRAGKTTFLHQVRNGRLGQTPAQHLPYLNFEDERLSGLEATHLSFLLEEQARQFGTPSAGRVAWFLDEIQVVPGWERFVRRLLDTDIADVFVTGSSAKLLSREIATSLRGRAWEVLIHPFSFGEALLHQGTEAPEDVGSLGSTQRSELERAFLKWLVAGGFPEVQSLDMVTRQRVLRDYIDVAMLRDVLERHRIGNVVALRWLVNHLLGNSASSFSINRFYHALRSQGVAASKETLHELLDHLEDSFVVRIVSIETDSVRQRMVNPRKIYPIDPALIPVFDRSRKANVGHALETAVYLELERRAFNITYVKTPAGFEVDFLARDHDGSMQLIQVCADASDPRTADRELRALEDASARFPEATLRLLTLNRDGLPAERPRSVKAQPAYEWMLDI